MQDISYMLSMAKRVRRHILDMVTKTNSSHIGSCYSIVEILVFLYTRRMDQRSDIDISNKSIFLLSKGHAAAALYAVLAEQGMFEVGRLNQYATNGSVFMSHVNSEVPGVTFSTGSLGHALPVAVGVALSRKKQNIPYSVYVLLSDGELNEGSNWEALMMARQLQLCNLVIIIDKNNIQGLGRTQDVINMGSIKDKCMSFGANVYEVDGHSYEALEACFQNIDTDIVNTSQCGPKVIIAHTVKGKGVSFMEDTVLWHYRSPKPEEYEQAIKEIEEHIV